MDCLAILGFVAFCAVRHRYVLLADGWCRADERRDDVVVGVIAVAVLVYLFWALINPERL